MLDRLRARYSSVFYRELFRLSIPIVVQNVLNAAVSSADVVMLNYVGQSSISAVSLAATYASILHMVYYGVGTGATILCAQYFGKKDFRAIEVVEGIAMRFSALISFAFALFAFFWPEIMMRAFTSDAELIMLGARYLRIMSAAYICTGISEVYLAVLRSIGRVGVCMAINIVTFCLNVLLNATFIFGLLGAPKLGVAGVAIATAISRAVELCLCFLVSARSSDVKLNPKFMFIRNKPLFRDYMRVAIPALANDVVWSLGFSMYSVILGHLGNDAVAANSLVSVVRNFGSVFSRAFASAGGVLLGKVLGENRLSDADAYSKKLVGVSFSSGIFGGLLVILSMPFIMRFATLNEAALGYLRAMLFINSYYITGASVNTMIICGVLRAGGDSRFGFWCDLIDMWAYAVPLGLLAAFVLKLPVLWVYFLLCTDEFVKWPFVFKRMSRRSWLKNITRDDLF